MQISLETKITTAVNLAAGAASAYLSPAQWISGFVVGFLSGAFMGRNAAAKVQSGASYYGQSDETTRMEGAKSLRRSLPGRATVALNLIACYALVSNLSIEIEKIAKLVTIAGFYMGYTLAKYSYLDKAQKLATSTNNQEAIKVLRSIVL